MALNDDILILSTVDLFASFTPEQLRLLAFGVERLVLRAGRELYQEGQNADCGYVVVSGQISLYRDTQQGRLTVRTVTKGTVLGELAMIAQSARLTGAIADVETEVIRISRSIFHRILEEYPEVAIKLHQQISRNLLALIDEIERVAPRLAGQG
ncbi:cyclic nucleotide-binding domain-containing protein [Daeguia caeni]|uniref:Cyclic nucleotide-binding domain-containing protein n=1 Tax=Daeguia caeni TaxID=439612 RepID=A0ABV9HAC6_9HYPH